MYLIGNSGFLLLFKHRKDNKLLVMKKSTDLSLLFGNKKENKYISWNTVKKH